MSYPTVKKLLSRGAASDNRYSATFTGGTAGDIGWTRDYNLLRELNEHSAFMISNMVMPGRSYATAETYGDQALGINRKYVHGTIFNEFALTYICEAGMSVYNIFHVWMETISPRSGNNPLNRRDIRMNYYNNYIDPKIILKKYERDGSVSMTTDVYNAFPLNVSDLSLSSGSQNGLLEFTVNFAYETCHSMFGGNSTEQASSSDLSFTGLAGLDFGIKYEDVFKNGVPDYSQIFQNPNNNEVAAIKDREDLAAWAIANERMVNSVGTPTQRKILSDANARYPQGSQQQKSLKAKYNIK